MLLSAYRDGEAYSIIWALTVVLGICLDQVRVGEEIAEMFFNPETSPGSTSTLKEQSQEASSSGDISSSVMSPISVDHWKYVASTSSDSSNCKDSSSVGNTDCVDQSYQESLTSEQEGSGEI